MSYLPRVVRLSGAGNPGLDQLRLASGAVTAQDFDAYFICATPRSGSTLLCGLLTSSGVAGRPASYFNRQGLHDYAQDWGITRPRDGRIDETYVRAALAAGKPPNGVFGGRIMAESLPELIGDLAAADPGSAGTDLERLSARFGRLKFVHLRRRDVVAQAVSWAKALQTHYWHADEAPARPTRRVRRHGLVPPGGRLFRLTLSAQTWRGCREPCGRAIVVVVLATTRHTTPTPPLATWSGAARS